MQRRNGEGARYRNVKEETKRPLKRKSPEQARPRAMAMASSLSPELAREMEGGKVDVLVPCSIPFPGLTSKRQVFAFLFLP